MAKQYQILLQNEVEALRSDYLKDIKARLRKLISPKIASDEEALSALTENLLAAARKPMKVGSTALAFAGYCYDDIEKMDAPIKRLLRNLNMDAVDKYQYGWFQQAAAKRQEDAVVEEVFGDRKRIYLKCDVDASSRARTGVEHALRKKGYTITSYKDGYATDAAGKQQFRIGKLLKDDEILLKHFENDPVRAGETLVVISRDTMDLARMSTNRGWRSCMAANGMYSDYLPKQIADGALVAYLISSRDPEINDPLARITIKSFEDRDAKDALEDIRCEMDWAMADAAAAREATDSFARDISMHRYDAETMEERLEDLKRNPENNAAEIQRIIKLIDDRRRRAEVLVESVLPRARSIEERRMRKFDVLQARFNRLSKRRKTLAYATSKTYGMGHASFEKVVAAFIKEHLNAGKTGPFEITKGMYDDGDNTTLVLKSKSKATAQRAV